MLDSALGYPFSQVLKNNKAYLLGGAVFPDWGYFCYQAGGPVAHQEPFLIALQQYIVQTYQPSTPQYDQLMAFMFGVASHIYSDFLWYYGNQIVTMTDFEGFITAMCHNGSICKDLPYATDQNPNCKQIGDWGMDVQLGVRYTGDGIYETAWAFPTYDIGQVYLMMGVNGQSQFLMDVCTKSMYTGFVLEKIFIDYLPLDYNSRASFLSEEPDLWFNGGLEDMAT